MSSGTSKSPGAVVRERIAQYRKYGRPVVKVAAEIEYERFDSVQQLLGRGTYSTVCRAVYRGRDYALKRLDTEKIRMNPREFKTMSGDLALEAEFLQRLDHPNIIKLHAKKGGSLTEALDRGEFFLVLELLGETMDEWLQFWREDRGTQKPQRRNKLMNWRSRNNRKQDREDMSLRELARVEEAALGVARAMEYIHRSGFVFRDLKPQNIGFDADNAQVKIFDFGIARELEVCRQTDMRLGFAGTPRYMAPEIGAGLEYDQSVDVYSFGIVLWEICTLSKPFPHMSTLEDFCQTVLRDGQRPPIQHVLNEDLRNLIQRCWHPIPCSRPTFTQIRQQLELILALDEPLAEATNNMSLSGGTVHKPRGEGLVEGVDYTMSLDQSTPPQAGDSP